MSDAADAIVRALVLNRAHHCLLVRTAEGFCVPEVITPSPVRPLVKIQQHVREIAGLTLPSPAGSLVPADGRGPRDFVFVVDASPLTAERTVTWVPLSRALEGALAAGYDRWIWATYVECMLGGWEPPARNLDVFFFGDAPEMAAHLAHLVACGRKRGTAAWRRSWPDGTPVPQPGQVSIVTDGFGFPLCAIQIEEVRTLRFADVGEEIAALEGEGDLTLANWRELHLAFFQREAEGLGLAFNEDEEIFVQRFRVLRMLGRSDEMCPA